MAFQWTPGTIWFSKIAIWSLKIGTFKLFWSNESYFPKSLRMTDFNLCKFTITIITSRELAVRFFKVFHWRKADLKLLKSAPAYLILQCFVSLCALFFVKFLFFHQMIALLKLWEMFFISPKKLFSFSRYSSVCSFFPSFPHFPDSKEQMEVE